MARTDSKEKGSAREQTLGGILNIPGVVGEPVWQELADEARLYIELHERLSEEPLDSTHREALEDALILSLNHLAIHSQILYESVDKAIETGLPEDIQQFTNDEETVENGILDYLTDIGATQQRIIEFLNTLTQNSKNISEQFVKTTEETNHLESIKDTRAKVSRLNIVSKSLTTHVTEYSIRLQNDLPDLRRDVSLFTASTSALLSLKTGSEETQSSQSSQYASILQNFKSSLGKLASIETLMAVMNNAQHDKRLTAGLRKACGRLESRLLVLLDTFKELDAFADEELAKLEN